MLGSKRGVGDALRWPLRTFGAAVVVVGLGSYLFPDAKSVLLAAGALVLAWVGWVWWDATRGAGAAIDELRGRWLDALAPYEAVASGDDVHVMEAGQPLIVRVGRRDGHPGVSVLTPLSETTTAFRIWPHAMPKPSFDGADPPVGGPLLTPLPAMEPVFGGAFAVEGNEPTRMMRYLDQDILSALLWAERLHPGTFRGLTFDGRFVAVHWLGELARDPLATLTASGTLWRPFVPRLPSAAPQLMH